MPALEMATKSAWNEYKMSLDQRQMVAEVHRLTEAGCSASAIAGVLDISERHVVRIRGELRNGKHDRIWHDPNRFDLTEFRAEKLETQADSVLDLADRLRDEDPALIYDILSRLDRQALLELAMIALAAIDTHRTKRELFEWLEQW